MRSTKLHAAMRGASPASRPSRRRFSFAFVLALLLPVSACYSYSAVEPSELDAGEEVRLEIGAQAVRELPQSIGQTSILAGTLVENTDEYMTVRVRVGERRSGPHTKSLMQRVRVRPNQVVAVRKKRLEGAKTAGLIGAGALAAGTAVWLSLEQFDRAGTPRPPPTGGQESRQPVFELPINIGF